MDNSMFNNRITLTVQLLCFRLLLGVILQCSPRENLSHVMMRLFVKILLPVVQVLVLSVKLYGQCGMTVILVLFLMNVSFFSISAGTQ